MHAFFVKQLNNILMKSFIFFLALFCELTLSAQAQYTVKGFVHNASLEGIPKVAIKVLDADTNLIVSEPLTGANGLFSFTSSPRKLRIYIESTGDYLSYTGEPFLLDKNIDMLAIALSTAVDLEEVVLTATQKKAAVYMEQGKIVFSPKNSQCGGRQPKSPEHWRKKQCVGAHQWEAYLYAARRFGELPEIYSNGANQENGIIT